MGIAIKKTFIRGYGCCSTGFDDYCISCILLAVDFEKQLWYYEEIPFWCRAKYCKRPRGNLELEIVKYGGTKDFLPPKKK